MLMFTPIWCGLIFLFWRVSSQASREREEMVCTISFYSVTVIDSQCKYLSIKMAGNKALNKANKAQEDEFYTQLSDIENELKHYTEHFKGKTVLCNCDDPRVSNFFHYFAYNFERLGLKRLITTCYKNQDSDLFSQNESEKAVYLIYEGDKNGSRCRGNRCSPIKR